MSRSTIELASAFSTPPYPRLDALLDVIGRANLVQAMKKCSLDESFIDKQRSLLATTKGMFRPEVSLALKRASEGNCSVAKAHIFSVLALGGWKGRVSLDVGDPTYVFFAGLQVELHGKFELVSTGDYLAVESGSECRVLLLRSEEKWNPAIQDTWTIIPSSEVVPFAIIDSGAVLEDLDFPDKNKSPNSRGRELSSPSLTKEVTHLQAACKLLADHSGVYYQWIKSYVKYCYLANLDQSSTDTSGTTHQQLGAIYLNIHPTVCLTAETLVHECSPLALYAACCLEPIVEPGSEEYFYSPVKRTARPLEMVFFAAHATVNVVRFLRDVKNSVGLLPQEQEELDRWESWLSSDYASAIRSAQTLTAFGRQIWAHCERELESP